MTDKAWLTTLQQAACQRVLTFRKNKKRSQRYMSSSDLVLSVDNTQQPTVLPYDGLDDEKEDEGDDVAMFELVKFGLPTLGIWLLQPLLSLIDSSIVGTSKTTTISEFAALGPGIAFVDSSSYIFNFIGIAVTTLYADALSKNDYRESNRVLTAAKSISFLLAILCFVIQWSFARFFINILTGPNKSVVPFAMIYSRIRSLGALAAVPTIAIQAAFLASKDSVTPLIAVVIGAVINVIGDLILVNKYGMGIAGAAWATMLAQFVTAIYLFKNEKSLRQSKKTNVELRLPKDPPRPTDVIRIGKEVKDDTVNIQVSYGTPEEMVNPRKGLPLIAGKDTLSVLEKTGDRGLLLPLTVESDTSDGSDAYQYDDSQDIYSAYLSVVDDPYESDDIMDVLEGSDETINTTDNVTGQPLIDIYDSNEGNEVISSTLSNDVLLEQEEEAGEVITVGDNDLFVQLDADVVVTDINVLDPQLSSDESTELSNRSNELNVYETDPSMEIEVLVPTTEALAADIDVDTSAESTENGSSLTATITSSVENVVESVADLIQYRKLLSNSQWSPSNSMNKSERVYSIENYKGPNLAEQEKRQGTMEVPSRMTDTGRPRLEEEITPEEALEIESEEALAIKAQNVVPPPSDISKSWKFTTAMVKSQAMQAQEATAQATTMKSIMMSDIPEPEAFFKWPDKREVDEFFGFCGPLFLILVLKTTLWNSTTVAVAPNGPVAMASHQILLNFFMYFVIFGDVLSQCSQTYLPALFRRSRKNILKSFESARKLMLTNLKLGVIVGGVNSIMAWLLAAYGTTFFTPSREVANLVRSAAMGFALCVLPHASLAGFEGVILSTRDVGYQGFVYVISSIFFVLYQNYVKVNQLGLAAVWNGFYLYQFFRLVLFGTRVKYLTNKRVRDGQAALERGDIESDLSL